MESWNLNIPVFTVQRSLSLFHRTKRERKKNTPVYVNQGIFLYFLCDPHPPTAILHLSLASAGRLVCWPKLQSFNFAFNQSFNFAFNQSLTEREFESQMLLVEVQLSARRWIWITDILENGQKDRQSTDPGVSKLLNIIRTSVKHNSYFNTMIDM